LVVGRSRQQRMRPAQEIMTIRAVLTQTPDLTNTFS
jgi:hypothetical protein